MLSQWQFCWYWLHWRLSNHWSHDCLFNRVFRCRSKKTSKLCVTGLCVGNSPVTGEFPAQMASDTENVSVFMTSSCFGQAVTALLSWPFSWSGCFHKVWPVICLRRVLFHRQFCYCNWNPMRIWFALTVFLGSISLQYFAHAMTVEMLCHVQNFVMITALKLGWGHIEIPLNYGRKLFVTWAPVVVRGELGWWVSTCTCRDTGNKMVL